MNKHNDQFLFVDSQIRHNTIDPKGDISIAESRGTLGFV